MPAKLKFDKILTKEMLYKAHIIDQRTAGDIALETHSSIHTVLRYLKIHNIPFVYYHGKRHHYGKKHHTWKGVGDMPGWYYNRLMWGAKHRDLKFTISKKYILKLYEQQGRKCAFSGLDIHFSNYNKNGEQTASLDRIDATKGYIKGNVVWVHKVVNFMKQQTPNLEFIKMCQLISTHSSHLIDGKDVKISGKLHRRKIKTKQCVRYASTNQT